MTPKQRAFFKGFALAAVAKKNSNLTKSYLCMAGAALYGIRAAREANRNMEEAFDKHDEKKSGPMTMAHYTKEPPSYG